MLSIYNKTVFVGSLAIVKNLFQNNSPYLPTRCIYNDRYAIKHSSTTKYHSIRVWKTKSLFDIWYNDMSSGTAIAALDYYINLDHIKIEYMWLNDDEAASYGNQPPFLSSEDSMELNSAMIKYIKDLAKQENKPKIIKDVHQNLRLFQKYYAPEGFIATDRTCRDNPFWVESELWVEPPSEGVKSMV